MNDEQPSGNPWLKSLLVWGGIFLALFFVVSLFGSKADTAGTQIRYSDFRAKVAEGSVSEVQVGKERITGKLKNGQDFSTVPIPNDASLPQLLADNNVKYAGEEAEQGSLMLYILAQTLPFLLILGIAYFALKQVQKGGGGGAMGFGKSKAKLLTEKQGRVTFNDVAGIDEAREELEEIVEFLRDPQRFSKLGGQIPKGALLVGSPGTGKTLLARAIAGEAGVPFFTISGSDFVEMFVGVGASRVRDMFEQAKKNAPCIVFIDEIDAVGRHRGHGLGNSNDEREQTLNQLLVEMDGFEANEGIIIIAATNRPDVLDPALLRPGRFDRQIIVPNPDVGGREKILRVHMRKVPLAPDVDPKTIARGTPGFSGADLANLVNEAALLAARRNKRLVTQGEFEDAKDKVMMGAERKSMVMTEEEKMMTAYHEAGHAIVNMVVPGNDPLHKVTIIPRGRALGVTMSLPERDRHTYTSEWCLAKLAMAFGGRVAEQLIYGKDHLNSGASGDITMATAFARSMVTEWGMSEKLGPVRYNDNQQEVFLGHAITQRQNMSEDTARLIDQEVRRIVTEGYNKAHEVLTAHIDQLKALTQALMEYETISGEDCAAIMRGEKIIRKDDDESTRGPAGSAVPVAGRSRPPRSEPDTGGMAPQPQG